MGPTRRLLVVVAVATAVAGTERNRPAEAKILGPGGGVAGGQGRRWGHSGASAPAGAPGCRPTASNRGRGALQPTLTRSGGGGRRVDGGGLGQWAPPGRGEPPAHSAAGPSLGAAKMDPFFACATNGQRRELSAPSALLDRPLESDRRHWNGRREHGCKMPFARMVDEASVSPLFATIVLHAHAFNYLSVQVSPLCRQISRLPPRRE